MLFNRTFLLEKLKSPAFSIFILLLFHISGLIGLHTNSKEWFLSLTPLNLIISVIVLLRHENFKNYKIISFAVLIFSLGYFLEVLGVNTGLIFGVYTYGPVLGFKLFSTPLLIGLNWFIMVYCIGTLLSKTNFQLVIKALIGAAMMTAVDYIIEPVAVAYNFWRWDNSIIPLQNYIAWFVFSFIFLVLFYKLKVETANKVAPWLLVTQIIFFLTLNLLI